MRMPVNWRAMRAECPHLRVGETEHRYADMIGKVTNSPGISDTRSREHEGTTDQARRGGISFALSGAIS